MKITVGATCLARDPARWIGSLSGSDWGPLPDVDAFKDDYRELPRGFAASHYPPARYQRGLFAHIAHGSRGLTTAPLCAARARQGRR